MLSSEKDYIYNGDRWMECMMRFETRGGQIVLKIWGELWGCRMDGKQAKLDFAHPQMASVIPSVERTFCEAWQGFGVKGNMNHSDHHFWFNVTLPLSSLELLKEPAFGMKLRTALATVVSSFSTFKPFCVMS